MDVNLLIKNKFFPLDPKGRVLIKNRSETMITILADDYKIPGMAGNLLLGMDSFGALYTFYSDGIFTGNNLNFDLVPPDSLFKKVTKYIILSKVTGDYITGFDSLEKANELGYGTELKEDHYVMIPVNLEYEVTWNDGPDPLKLQPPQIRKFSNRDLSAMAEWLTGKPLETEEKKEEDKNGTTGSEK